MIQRTTRPGFTLLEVLLASAIGMVLLSALYVAVENQISQTQAARDIVEQSTLARTVLNRMETDITATITLSDPGRFRNPKSSTASSGAASGSTGTAATDASGMTTDTGSGNATPITVPLGIMGDSTSLHLFVSKVPRDAIKIQFDDIAPPASDTRRISYWLVDGGGDNRGGLAKQEVKLITSLDVLENNLPPGIPNENTFIIAEEVRSLVFQYYDGTTWMDTWDSTQPGNDGVTPIGPPRAISIEIEFPGIGSPDAPLKRYRHVVSLLTANGTTIQSQPATGGGTSP